LTFISDASLSHEVPGFKPFLLLRNTQNYLHHEPGQILTTRESGSQEIVLL